MMLWLAPPACIAVRCRAYRRHIAESGLLTLRLPSSSVSACCGVAYRCKSRNTGHNKYVVKVSFLNYISDQLYLIFESGFKLRIFVFVDLFKTTLYFFIGFDAVFIDIFTLWRIPFCDSYTEIVIATDIIYRS